MHVQLIVNALNLLIYPMNWESISKSASSEILKQVIYRRTCLRCDRLLPKVVQSLVIARRQQAGRANKGIINIKQYHKFEQC